MSQDIDAIECTTGESPAASVIWLHGLGADGSDFVPLLDELALPGAPALRFIFPHAPMIPVTCNNGYVMRAWYDIAFLDGIHRQVDEAGVLRSCSTVRALISRENLRGIPASRIVLAGFSQGGAIAWTAGLTHGEPLAGIIALSTYLPAPGLLDVDACAANRATPVFAAHGNADDVVPPTLGRAARDAMRAAGHRVEWHEYPMGHSVCPEEIADLDDWLCAILAGPAAIDSRYASGP